MSTYIILLLVFIGFVESKGYPAYPSGPCSFNDTKCIFEAMSKFYLVQSTGMPEYDIKQIDPLKTSSLDVENEDGSIVFHLKDITITGLKKQTFTAIKVNRDLKHSQTEFSVNGLNIVADIDMEFINLCRTYSGLYTAIVDVTGAMDNDYSLVKYDDEDHFEIGPQTYECQTVEAEIWLSDDLRDDLENDPDTSCLSDVYENSLRTEVIHQILRTAHTTLVHNIKVITRLLPSTSFYTDF